MLLNKWLSSAILFGEFGGLAGAQKLLQQGADIKLVAGILFSAIGMCNVEAVRFMIDAGTPLDVEDFEKRTLLQKARSTIGFIQFRPDLHRLRPAVRKRMLGRAEDVLRLLEAAGAK